MPNHGIDAVANYIDILIHVAVLLWNNFVSNRLALNNPSNNLFSDRGGQ